MIKNNLWTALSEESRIAVFVSLGGGSIDDSAKLPAGFKNNMRDIVAPGGFFTIGDAFALYLDHLKKQVLA